MGYIFIFFANKGRGAYHPLWCWGGGGGRKPWLLKVTITIKNIVNYDLGYADNKYSHTCNM